MEPKQTKDKEVDWFAEHADADSNEHAHAQVTRTRLGTPRLTLIILRSVDFWSVYILIILNFINSGGEVLCIKSGIIGVVNFYRKE